MLRWRSSDLPMQLIGFINTAEAKPFTLLNSTYSVNNPVAGKLFNVTLYELDVILCLMFQDDGCDKFTEMCKLLNYYL